MTPSQMRGRLDAPTVEVSKLSSKAAFESTLGLKIHFYGKRIIDILVTICEH